MASRITLTVGQTANTREGSMTALNRGEPKIPLPVLLLFFTVLAFTLNALPSYAKSAGEILSDYGRPPDKGKESRFDSLN
jgi:hypothetical protein